MEPLRGKPSTWLLKNSKGYPDFLFTILTYSMLLLVFISLVWITFGLLTFIHAGSLKAETILKIMDSMKTGLISLTGVIFGLAGSYTVRRFKKDQQFTEQKKIDVVQNGKPALADLLPEGLKFVDNEEDI